MEYQTVDDRILVVKIDVKPRKLGIIQVYAPTAGNAEENIKFDDELDAVSKSIPKLNIKMMIRDLNAKVGRHMSSTSRDVVGKGGLGEGNKARERLLDFFIDHVST